MFVWTCPYIGLLEGEFSLQEAITRSLQGDSPSIQAKKIYLFEPKESSSANNQSMSVPEGEDSFYFEWHNCALKLEHDKVHPKKQVVEELMAQSFAMRWNDLHDNSYGLDTVFEKYPFLADVSKVSQTTVCLYTMVYAPFNIYRSFETW